MKWVDNIMEKVKGGIRSWLNVQAGESLKNQHN